MSTMLRKAVLQCAVAAPLVLACAGHAWAQPKGGGYPVRPIRLLVGNAPGGGIDITARAVGQKLSEEWGRSVVVDNRPGGAGLIAIDLAAHATPDGYTLLVTSGSLVSSVTAQKKLPYDTRKKLAPITQLTTLCYMLMVNPSVPANSVREFIAYAKARPGTLNYGSSGVGGAGHLAGELFSSMAGIKTVHIPYKGGGLVLLSMIAGQVQFGFTATISGLGPVRSGKLRALGVTSAHRSPVLPDIPAIAESGLPGFELVNWYGLFAPAGTPRAIVAALHGATGRALHTPEVQAMFAKDGAEAVGSATPAAFERVFHQEVIAWEKIIKMPAFAESLK